VAKKCPILWQIVSGVSSTSFLTFIELNDAEEVLDQNGEAAVGVYHKMYAKNGHQRGLYGDAKRIVLSELQSNCGKVDATMIVGILEDKDLDHAVAHKQITVR